MKRVILIAALLAFITTSFAQTGSWYNWPKDWGRTGSWVEYATPYQANGWIYQPATYEWLHGTESGKSYFTVTCDIEMYMSMHFDATDIYFHIADDRTSMSAYVNGWIASNNGQYLFVSSELDAKHIDRLDFVENIFGGSTPAGCPPIPVEWWLKDETDTDFRIGTYSQGGNNGNLWGVTWLIANGEPCTHYFTIRVDIKPAFHQPDGRYEMDPLVTISPVI